MPHPTRTLNAPCPSAGARRNYYHYGGLVIISLALLASCTLPRVRMLEQPQTDTYHENRLLDPDQLTDATADYLRMHRLKRSYRRDARKVIVELHTAWSNDPSSAGRLALMELCLDQGGRQAADRPELAAGYYLAAAQLASAGVDLPALAGQPPSHAPSASDPDLSLLAFNHSSGQIARLLFDSKRSRTEATTIAGPWQRYRLHLRIIGDAEVSDDKFFDRLEAAEYMELDFTNIERFTRAGIGAAMVGSRDATPARQLANPYLSPMGMAVPVNATLTFTSKDNAVELLLSDLTRSATIELDGHTVPLSADLTAPLVLLYNQIKEPHIAWKGLLHPDDYLEYMRIYQLEPYHPDKIPVIFVHGLISSPKIWLPALNVLNADPLLRERYQLFAFVYPTGFPIAYSAAAMRRRLSDLPAHFDSRGNNPNMQHMLLVGHSMGGILANMQVRNSGDTLHSTFFKAPLDDLAGLDDAQVEALRSLLFYQANPSISRAVFVATPHRGSDSAEGPRGKLGNLLIEDPTTTVIGSTLPPSSGMTEAGIRLTTRKLTSITSLEPHSPELAAILKQDLAPDVTFHSVIGRKSKTGPLADSSDGTVAYWSSHLEGASSETIVTGKHTPMVKHPDTIEELRRLLYEHAGITYTPM